MLAPVWASAIAAASPAGPPPITAASYAPDASFISGQLTFPEAFSSPHPAAIFQRFARRNAATADVQTGIIPDSTAGQMDQTNQQDSQGGSASPLTRGAAFFVHIFTGLGAGIALVAVLEAAREHRAALVALAVTS